MIDIRTMASRKTAKSREPDVLSAAYLEGTSNKVSFVLMLLLLYDYCAHAYLPFHEGEVGDTKNDVFVMLEMYYDNRR